MSNSEVTNPNVTGRTRDYYAGMTQGRIDERERIIKMLNDRANDWGGHEGNCDCQAKATEDLDLIQLIKGEANE